MSGKRTLRDSDNEEDDQPKRACPADTLALSNNASDSDPDTTTAPPPIEDEEDLVLSEVHIDPSNGAARTHGLSRRLTTFKATDPHPPLHSDPTTTTFTIEHDMATPLHSVGLQVWSGALLLADFVLSHRDTVFTPTTTVLELGCGAGLVAAVCATVSGKVYATDRDGRSVLELCERNVGINGVKDNVVVRAVDFLDDACPLFLENVMDVTDRAGPYVWTADDLTDFQSTCTVLVAADIIYDRRITFAFVRRLPTLLRPTTTAQQPRVLYLALERRVQFALDGCHVTAPACDFLFDTLDAVNADRDEGAPRVVAERVDVDKEVPQWIQYRRVKELELWKFFIEEDKAACGVARP